MNADNICPLCREARSAKSRSRICPTCMSWWRYHFRLHKHGPTYFAGYIQKAERALSRSAFAKGPGAKVVIDQRFNGEREEKRRGRSAG